MGLLDLFDNPDAQMGLGLLAAASPRADAAGFGQRLMEGVQGAQGMRDAQAKRKMYDMQLQEAQLKLTNEKAMRELAQKFAIPAQPAQGAGLPADVSAGLPPEMQTGVQVAPTPAKPASFDFQGYSNALAPFNPSGALSMQQQLVKDNTPIPVKADETLVDRHTFKPVFTAPKTFTKPALQQEFELAVSQGYKGTLMDYQLALKKAGATNVNNTVSVAGPENEYNKTIGKTLADTSTALVASAQQSPNIVANARAIKDALDKGAISGTGAEIRLAAQKAAETLGIVPSGKAATTQELMSGLGKLTLSGIKTSGLGGGNGFTDKDREFLNAAVSGNLSDTPENLRRVADLSEKAAIATHQKGNAVLDRWKKNPSLASLAQDQTIDPIPFRSPLVPPTPAAPVTSKIINWSDL